jgi:hypothetical protein
VYHREIKSKRAENHNGSFQSSAAAHNGYVPSNRLLLAPLTTVLQLIVVAFYQKTRVRILIHLFEKNQIVWFGFFRVAMMMPNKNFCKAEAKISISFFNRRSSVSEIILD